MRPWLNLCQLHQSSDCTGFIEPGGVPGPRQRPAARADLAFFRFVELAAAPGPDPSGRRGGCGAQQAPALLQGPFDLGLVLAAPSPTASP